jgi:hypothetical protein
MEWAELGDEFQKHNDFPACTTVWGRGDGSPQVSLYERMCGWTSITQSVFQQ